jgi:hypothetical protein
MPLSRRSRLTLPSEWHLELRACVADSAVYAQYLDGVLAPDRSRELEETTLWANLRVEANVYIRNLLALCIEALGYLSPKGLDSFREHTDLAELTPSPSEGDSSGYATEDLAVVGIADDTELDWDRAHDAAATQGLTDEIAALQTGLDGFRLDLNWVDVPGGVLAVFAERGNDGTQWQQVVTQLRDAGVLDELGATLASPHPRSMPR